MRAAVEQNGLALQYAHHSLRKKANIVRHAVEENPGALKFISRELEVTEDILCEAVARHGWDLVSGNLISFKWSKAVAKAAVLHSADALLRLPVQFKKDIDVVTAATSKFPRALECVDPSFHEQNNYKLAEDVVTKNGLALEYVKIYTPRNMVVGQMLISVVLAAVQANGLALKHADRFQTNGDIVLAAVKQNGLALQFADRVRRYVPVSLQQCKTIVLAAVKRNGLALQFAHSSLRKQHDVVLAAVEKTGLALQFADSSLQRCKDIVLAAVKQNGLALEYAHSSLRKQHDVVLAAVQKDGSALEFAHPLLRRDTDIVLAAVQKDGSALQFADRLLRADEIIVLPAVQKDGSALQFAHSSLKKDTDVVLAAVDQDGLALEFADFQCTDDRDTINAVIHTAVLRNALAFQFAQKENLTDADYEAALQQDVHVLEFMDDDDYRDIDIMTIALRTDYWVALHYVIVTEGMVHEILRGALRAKYSEVLQLLNFRDSDVQASIEIVRAAVERNGLAVLDYIPDWLKYGNDFIDAIIPYQPRVLEYVSLRNYVVDDASTASTASTASSLVDASWEPSSESSMCEMSVFSSWSSCAADGAEGGRGGGCCCGCCCCCCCCCAGRPLTPRERAS